LTPFIKTCKDKNAAFFEEVGKACNPEDGSRKGGGGGGGGGKPKGYPILIYDTDDIDGDLPAVGTDLATETKFKKEEKKEENEDQNSRRRPSAVRGGGGGRKGGGGGNKPKKCKKCPFCPTKDASTAKSFVVVCHENAKVKAQWIIKAQLKCEDDWMKIFTGSKKGKFKGGRKGASASEEEDDDFPFVDPEEDEDVEVEDESQFQSSDPDPPLRRPSANRRGEDEDSRKKPGGGGSGGGGGGKPDKPECDKDANFIVDACTSQCETG